MKKKDEKEFSLEEKLKRLRAITEKMQLGQITFDENITLFHEGMDLVKACQDYLDKAELMVTQLTDGENGDAEADFES